MTRWAKGFRSEPQADINRARPWFSCQLIGCGQQQRTGNARTRIMVGSLGPGFDSRRLHQPYAFVFNALWTFRQLLCCHLLPSGFSQLPRPSSLPRALTLPTSQRRRVRRMPNSISAAHQASGLVGPHTAPERISSTAVAIASLTMASLTLVFDARLIHTR